MDVSNKCYLCSILEFFCFSQPSCHFARGALFIYQVLQCSFILSLGRAVKDVCIVNCTLVLSRQQSWRAWAYDVSILVWNDGFCAGYHHFQAFISTFYILTSLTLWVVGEHTRRLLLTVLISHELDIDSWLLDQYLTLIDWQTNIDLQMLLPKFIAKK